MSTDEIPVLAVPLGDPNGVGPEIVAKALLRRQVDAAVVAVGPRWLLEHGIEVSALDAQIEEVDLGVDATALRRPSPAGTIRMIACEGFGPEQLTIGQATASAGAASVEYLLRATDLAVDGAVDAICTPPINKEALSAAGFVGIGHTELLADHLGVERQEITMMLASERIRVAHVSTHVSLRQAIELVTPDRVARVARLLHTALSSSFGQPRIAIAGLNPHSGEHGLFGDEDDEVLRPVVRRLVSEGIDCAGPVPPDTVFLAASEGRFDGVVAMYHDQGHIPAKLSGFADTVNVTLGLPIIRTSVDHGTAYDIAGTGVADEANMVAALRTARSMIATRP